MRIIIAVTLVILNGPDGQVIYVNPVEIVSVRAPLSELIHPDIKCTLQTVDGKLINVINTCEEVLHRIGKTDD